MQLSDYPITNIQHLGMLLGEANTDSEIFRAIVDAPFDTYPVATAMMFLGIIVLLLVNKETGQIDRVALSSTEIAKRTTEVSAVPFNDIKIDATEQCNVVAAAVRSQKTQETTDWEELFTPALSGEQARINQANAGIAYSVVYPFAARDGGALIFSYYQFNGKAGKAQHDFMTEYTELVNHRLRS